MAEPTTHTLSLYDKNPKSNRPRRRRAEEFTSRSESGEGAARNEFHYRRGAGVQRESHESISLSFSLFVFQSRSRLQLRARDSSRRSIYAPNAWLSRDGGFPGALQLIVMHRRDGALTTFSLSLVPAVGLSSRETPSLSVYIYIRAP